jgi:hypothetical protein
MSKFKSLLAQVQSVLQGEPALVIGNGAAVVIYIVAKASGFQQDETFALAAAQAAGALAIINSVLVSIRQYVSPAA